MTITGLKEAISGEKIVYEGDDSIVLKTVTFDVPNGAGKEVVDDEICKAYNIVNGKISYNAPYGEIKEKEEEDTSNQVGVDDEGNPIYGTKTVEYTEEKETNHLIGDFIGSSISKVTDEMPTVQCTFNVKNYD